MLMNQNAEWRKIKLREKTRELLDNIAIAKQNRSE